MVRNIDSSDISQGGPLTICNKMLRHVEGDLDGKRAWVLCCIDDGNDTRADGNQCQGDLVQWTVEVAWRKEERTRIEKKNTGRGVKASFIWIFAKWRPSKIRRRNTAQNTQTRSLFLCLFPQPLENDLNSTPIYEFNPGSILTEASKRLLSTFASSHCRRSPGKTTRPPVIYGFAAT